MDCPTVKPVCSLSVRVSGVEKVIKLQEREREKPVNLFLSPKQAAFLYIYRGLVKKKDYTARCQTGASWSPTFASRIKYFSKGKTFPEGW